MRGLALWTLPVIVFLGGTVVAQAQGTDPASSQAAPKGTLWASWLPFGKKADNSKPAPRESTTAQPHSGSGDGDSPVAIGARELAALNRRLAVCEKLKEIAWETKDEQLGRKAEQLDQRVWAVYWERTGHASPDKGATSESDEQILRSFSQNLQPQPTTLTLPRLDVGSGVATRRENP
jgi:hypothetical protein